MSLSTFFNSNSPMLWLAIGMAGQVMFSMRFLIQWLASEKAKKSVMPNAFWYFSIGGGLALFIYALHLQDPVFILGQGVGLVVYLRNLHFIRNVRATQTADIDVHKTPI